MWNSTSTGTPITDSNSPTFHSHFLMLRKITTHPENSVRFTPAAKEITQKLNEFRRVYGDVPFEIMAKVFNLQTTNCARYYYGIHHFQGGYANGTSYTQMRRGACVDL